MMHCCTDTASQRNTVSHLAMHDDFRQAMHKKEVSRTIHGRAKQRRNLPANSPLPLVSYRSKFTPCGMNSPAHPCCTTWVLRESLGKLDPTPIGYISIGEHWKESKGLGLSIQKGDHLGLTETFAKATQVAEGTGDKWDSESPKRRINWVSGTVVNWMKPRREW